MASLDTVNGRYSFSIRLGRLGLKSIECLVYRISFKLSVNMGFTMVDLGSLKWQLRRGKLELDIVLQRFRERYPFEQLSESELQALEGLLKESDDELLELFLDRHQPADPGQQKILKKILHAAHSNPG